MGLSFFDCNVRIGQPAIPIRETPECYGHPDRLQREMEYFGIRDALVFHVVAEHGDARLGNGILMEDIGSRSNLHPCWVVWPGMFKPEEQPESLIQKLKRHDVRAVRMFPGGNAFGDEGYPVSEWMCGKLLRVLEKNRIPVFFPSLGGFGGAGNIVLQLQSLRDLCSTYAELPVVVGGWATSPKLLPLLGLHKNLYIDTCLLSHPAAVENICAEYGADRLLFGTRYGTGPFMSPGAAITMISTANIPDQDKQKIAGDNLRRLLGRPADANSPDIEYDCPFIGPLRKGEPVSGEIVIDAHGHNGVPDGVISYATPHGMVVMMDRFGVDVACISILPRIVGGNVVLGNDLCMETVRSHPERFVGYAAVNPRYPEVMQQELERCRREAGFRHVKIHPERHNYPVTGSNYDAAWEFALKHKSVVLCHSALRRTTCAPAMFDELAERHPDINIIMGHGGNINDAYKDAVEVALKRKNIYLDTSGWCMTSLGVVEYVVDRLGAERVLMGTDFILLAQGFQLGPVAYAKISEDDKRKIMGLNAAKLFGITVKIA